MRGIKLDGRGITGKGPLNGTNGSESSDLGVTLAEAEDGKITSGEFDAALAVNEMEDRAGYGEDGVLHGGREVGGAIWRRVGEEVLGEVRHVDGGVHRRR